MLGPPLPRAWADRDPIAARRLVLAREEITALAAANSIPIENLLTPESLRRVAWTPPEPATGAHVTVPVCPTAIVTGPRRSTASSAAFVNSWVTGFFPYENPKYAFALVMERGPKEASGNATRVMSEVVDYMNVYTDYLK